MSISNIETSASLPSLRRCKSLTLREDEVLIVAAGFEDRALASIRCACIARGSRVFVLRYDPGDDKNRLREMLSALGSVSLRARREDIVIYNRLEPDSFPTPLRARLEDAEPARVIIDVSAMSKLAILLCLDVCRELNLNVDLFYAEAARYAPSREEYEVARREKNLHRPTIQVYTGLHGIVRASRLSSVAMQGQPIAAVVFMSFNEQFTQALLNTVYPSRLFLINGRPPELGWREFATAWIHEEVRREWGDEDNPVDEAGMLNQPRLPRRAVSTLDYRETVAVLLDLYWQLALDHRTLLAPTGSKMQTVGCFFAKTIHPDIHIEYPTPRGFLQLYSSGIGTKWLVHLGKLGDRVAALRRKEKRRRLGINH